MPGSIHHDTHQSFTHRAEKRKARHVQFVALSVISLVLAWLWALFSLQ